MLESLGTIYNPLIRSFAFASSAFTFTTLVYALALIFSSSSLESVIKKIGIVPLTAFFTGATVGLVTRVDPERAEEIQSDNSKDLGWQGWRDFEVFHKEVESQEITSFYFRAVDGEALPDFKPGQFLTIKLDVPGESRPVIRSYSFSDFARSPEYYRLSIKREGAPQNLDVPPGVASNFMHDHVDIGSIVACKSPNGKFFLDLEKTNPIILLSNGVGVTPMVSMAKACIAENPGRHVWFIHGARNGSYHALRDEMNRLEELAPNLYLHYCYSRPQIEDTEQFHSQGYADTQLIADTILPTVEEVCGNSTEAEYYICGSPAFMDSLIEGLAESGVSKNNVFYESFGGGKTKGQSSAINTQSIDLGSESGSVDSAEVVFTQSDLTLTWTPEDGTLLEFAQANGLEPDSSCCQGICMVCECQLAEGEVEYVESPTCEPDANSVLMCIAKPKTARVVLDL